ncbi:hypothetical protein E1211_17880 [Micromonospora sp. 15K316]|uniref:hypothetical protein n=1 Tax=Micromonospora sp. 15K316 TaxID=2530376 RepID=UPI001051B217|nr:hypothetical protein [Micromonospora sp. 15K316]TDC34217.1 hypothetical protein E1211_17880 [Micromonospora sp. 15K316]
MAETYARHARNAAGDKGADADLTWLTYPRLMAKAGIRRRAKVPAIVAALVDAGWLAVVHQAARRPTLYRLTIPARSSDAGTTDSPGSTDGGTTDGGSSDTPGSSDGGTTVVPHRHLGSSTSAAGSSNGGTQPLPPQEPLTPTPRAEGADAERDDPHRAAAVALVDPYRADMTVPDARTLTRAIADALRHGWPATEIEAVLARKLAGLNDVGLGLLRRIQKLGPPPTPDEIPNRSTPRAASGQPFRNLDDQAYLDWVGQDQLEPGEAA